MNVVSALSGLWSALILELIRKVRYFYAYQTSYCSLTRLMLAKHCNGATEQGHLNRTKPQQLTKQSRRTV